MRAVKGSVDPVCPFTPIEGQGGLIESNREEKQVRLKVVPLVHRNLLRRVIPVSCRTGDAVVRDEVWGGPRVRDIVVENVLR